MKKYIILFLLLPLICIASEKRSRKALKREQKALRHQREEQKKKVDCKKIVFAKKPQMSTAQQEKTIKELEAQVIVNTVMLRLQQCQIAYLDKQIHC